MEISANVAVPILMIIVGGVLYHVAQKATPASVDPFLSLFASFIVAALACLAISLSRGRASLAQFRHVNWTAVALATALIAIESGYLIGYRAGLKLNITSFACNAAIAVILFAIGTFMYGEGFSARAGIGAGLCLVGLVMLKG
jgi:drug/metabolite transporter (DMT)-like permease